MREVMRLIHPNAVIAVKVGKVSVPDGIAQAVWGFFSVYVMLFFLMLVGVMATGVDQVTAWSAVASAPNNLGPALEIGRAPCRERADVLLLREPSPREPDMPLHA